MLAWLRPRQTDQNAISITRAHEPPLNHMNTRHNEAAFLWRRLTALSSFSLHAEGDGRRCAPPGGRTTIGTFRFNNHHESDGDRISDAKNDRWARRTEGAFRISDATCGRFASQICRASSRDKDRGNRESPAAGSRRSRDPVGRRKLEFCLYEKWVSLEYH